MSLPLPSCHVFVLCPWLCWALLPSGQSRQPISAARLQPSWVTAPWWNFCSIPFALHLVWGNQHFTASLPC